jgi:hypothetical protein
MNAATLKNGWFFFGWKEQLIWVWPWNHASRDRRLFGNQSDSLKRRRRRRRRRKWY